MQASRRDLSLRRFIEHPALPAPRGVAVALLNTAGPREPDPGVIAAALHDEPTLAAAILRLAAVAADAPQPIGGIGDAVARLGLFAVRSLALGFSLMVAEQAVADDQFGRERFWSRSLASAVIAQALGEHLKLAAPEQLFALGLLMRIGELALANVYPGKGDLLPAAQSAMPLENVMALQRQRLGFDHGDATALMLERWGFPKLYVDIIGTLHRPEVPAGADESRTTALANALALAGALSELFIGDPPARRRLLSTVSRYAALLAIDESSLDALIAKTAKLWEEWGALLRVETRSVPPLAELQQISLHADTPEGGEQSAGRAHRVLVVDDDRAVRAFVQAVLMDAGFIVTTAGDGAQALAAIREQMPDMIVTDWEMPNMDGLKFCRTLRNLPGGRYVYVMILTGHGEDTRLQEGFEAGADDYLSKPLKPIQLLARLRAGRRFIDLHRGLAAEGGELRRFAADLVAANRRLEAVAQLDALTGLANRRYILDRLDQEFSASRRKNTALTVLGLDVDHFKSVNDTYGHPAGDEVLMEMARQFRALARTEDTVGRIGGEEFLMICPDCDLAGAMGVAERLRAGVADLQWPALQGRKITVSIGVATRDAGVTEPKQLVERADSALYQAKHGGRNRCVAYTAAAADPAKDESPLVASA